MKQSSLLAVLLLSVSACSLAPEGNTPTDRIPDSWTIAGEPATTRAEWADFNSTELTRLIAVAQAQNTDLAAALARVEQARAQTSIAGSGLYPQVETSGNAGRTRSESNGNGVTTNSASATLSVSYELDLWQKNRNQFDSALWSLRASEYDRNALSLTVASEVARLYTGLLAYDARLAVAEQNLANARATLKVTEARYAQGAISGLEHAQQRTSVANTEATIATLKNQRALFFNALALMVGTSPSQLAFTNTETLAQLALPQVALGTPWQLLAQRPDIAASEAQLKAANLDIGVARAQALPSLSLGLDAGVSANPSTQLVGLAASFFAPIFKGGALEGAIEQSEAIRDERVAQYQGVLLTAFREVEDALSNVDAATQRREALQVAAEEARKADSIARAQFDAGSIDYTTFITTQNARLTAEDGYLGAMQEQLAATIDLMRALGGPVTQA